MTHHAVHREAAALATEMIALFGGEAGEQARQRARKSRDRGNVVLFCRWREAQRLIQFLSVGPEDRTVH